MSMDTDSETEAVPTKKVTVYFTGKIEFEASLVDLVGTPRTDTDIAQEVIGAITSEINENLMYSDNDRAESDLVQGIAALRIWDTSRAVIEATQEIQAFEQKTAPWRDEDGDVQERHQADYDSARAVYEESAGKILPAFADDHDES